MPTSKKIKKVKGFAVYYKHDKLFPNGEISRGIFGEIIVFATKKSATNSVPFSITKMLTKVLPVEITYKI